MILAKLCFDQPEVQARKWSALRPRWRFGLVWAGEQTGYRQRHALRGNWCKSGVLRLQRLGNLFVNAMSDCLPNGELEQLDSGDFSQMAE
jgi:hypothetical protein